MYACRMFDRNSHSGNSTGRASSSLRYLCVLLFNSCGSGWFVHRVEDPSLARRAKVKFFVINHNLRQLVLTFVCGVFSMGGVAWFVAVAFFGWGGFGIGVGRANFKIGLGAGSGIEGAEGANFEVCTPDPVCNSRPRLLFDWLAKSFNLDDLANQSKCLRNRGLVIGWPT